MENKRIRDEDCKIDWKTYFVEEDEDGQINQIPFTQQDCERELAQLIEEDCSCDEFSLATQDKCYRYHIYSKEYDLNKYAEYAKYAHYTESNIAFWGLSDMINDGWLKSAAFVDWKEMAYCVERPQSLKNLLLEINNPTKRVELLQFLIKDADNIFGQWKKETLPVLRNFLYRQQAAERIAKKQAAEQRKLAKQERPELVLSVDEIIDYAVNTNPDGAHSIQAMLYYMVLHREGWNSKTVLKKIDSIANTQGTIHIETNNGTINN